MEDEVSYSFWISIAYSMDIAQPCEIPRTGNLLTPAACDNGFHIANECIEGHVLHVPIRKAIAARVISNEPVISGQPAEYVAPDWTVPVIFEMVEPVRCLN